MPDMIPIKCAFAFRPYAHLCQNEN